MINRKRIKTLAKRRLQENLLSSIVVILFLFTISILWSIILAFVKPVLIKSGLQIFYFFCISLPLDLLLAKYFLLNSRYEKVSLIEVLRSFMEIKGFPRTVLSKASTSVLLSLLYLPGFVCLLIAQMYFITYLSFDRLSSEALNRIPGFMVQIMNLPMIAYFGFAILGVALCIPGILKQLDWYFVSQVLVEYPVLNGNDSRREAESISYGVRWDLVMFELSFIPWYILVACTFGLAAFWVVPYRMQAVSEMYRRLAYDEEGVELDETFSHERMDFFSEVSARMNGNEHYRSDQNVSVKNNVQSDNYNPNDFPPRHSSVTFDADYEVLDENDEVISRNYAEKEPIKRQTRDKSSRQNQSQQKKQTKSTPVQKERQAQTQTKARPQPKKQVNKKQTSVSKQSTKQMDKEPIQRKKSTGQSTSRSTNQKGKNIKRTVLKKDRVL